MTPRADVEQAGSAEGSKASVDYIAPGAKAHLGHCAASHNMSPRDGGAKQSEATQCLAWLTLTVSQYSRCFGSGLLSCDLTHLGRVPYSDPEIVYSAHSVRGSGCTDAYQVAWLS